MVHCTLWWVLLVNSYILVSTQLEYKNGFSMVTQWMATRITSCCRLITSLGPTWRYKDVWKHDLRTRDRKLTEKSQVQTSCARTATRSAFPGWDYTVTAGAATHKRFSETMHCVSSSASRDRQKSISLHRICSQETFLLTELRTNRIESKIFL